MKSIYVSDLKGLLITRIYFDETLISKKAGSNIKRQSQMD